MILSRQSEVELKVGTRVRVILGKFNTDLRLSSVYTIPYRSANGMVKLREERRDSDGHIGVTVIPRLYFDYHGAEGGICLLAAVRRHASNHDLCEFLSPQLLLVQLAPATQLELHP